MKFLKQILVILVIVINLLFLNIREVNGALQANKNTHDKTVYHPTNWMTNFRKMETAGEAMGLNEILNEDLTASSESNNIDVHMIRSTEYGAIAILSVSGYGNQKNENIITSTTGNNTGMILATKNWDAVAGGLEGYIFTGTNERYYDTYTLYPTSARVGDALGNSTAKNSGCAGWHKATHTRWGIEGFCPYFGRYMKFNFSDILNGNGDTNQRAFARGVVVCGIGI